MTAGANGRVSIGRRRFLTSSGLLGAGVLLAIACRGGRRSALTTIESTIRLDEHGSLVYASGQPYVVRTDLEDAQGGRDNRRSPLLAFHHFSDFRIVDEESPLRSEWVEACRPAVTTDAFRPQESLSLQAAAAMIGQANRINQSEITGRPVDFALHTGNAADNAQYNELRWFLDLMDGKDVNPDSGKPGYEGLQAGSPAPAYDHLLQDAQSRFSPQGLRYPWYAVVGNRDLLSQGNFPPDEAARAIAVGSVKVTGVGKTVLDDVCRDPQRLAAPAPRVFLKDPEMARESVSADGNRRPLSRQEWIEEHFNTAPSPGPSGHGFTEANRKNGTAYYAVDSGPVALIVLDTANPGGFAAGSIDADQFAWLEEQLKARSRRYIDRAGKAVTSSVREQLIVIASHHTCAAMNNPFPGLKPQTERFRGPQVEALLHRFPNVVLHVAGHDLAYRITPKPDAERRTKGYWEITTGSPLDFPMQSRLVEIVANGDGTLSIFSTLYDSAAPVNPGDAHDPTPDDGVNQLLLASVARQVAANDPQRFAGAYRPAASDGNAELLLASPFNVDESQSRTATPVPGARRLSRRALLGIGGW